MDKEKLKLEILQVSKSLKLLEDALDLGDNRAIGASFCDLKNHLLAIEKIADERPVPARRGRGRS